MWLPSRNSSPTYGSSPPSPKRHLGVLLLCTIALTFVLLYPLDGRSKGTDLSWPWTRIRATWFGKQGNNDGTVSLQYNEYWQKNWNESTLLDATRTRSFDPWAKQADMPPEQHKTKQETIRSLRRLLIDLPREFPR
jgi:hypothetical protein